MDPNKYFSGYNLKNARRKQKFGYAENAQFGKEIFTLSPVAYIYSKIQEIRALSFRLGKVFI